MFESNSDVTFLPVLGAIRVLITSVILRMNFPLTYVELIVEGFGGFPANKRREKRNCFET